MAPDTPATPRSIQRLAPGSPAACHTWAAVHHKTSPTPALRSPRPFEHSSVRPALGLPSDGFALAHCDAAPAPTTRGRFAAVLPVFAHRVDHLFDCFWKSIALFVRALRSLRGPVPLTAGLPTANVFLSPGR